MMNINLVTSLACLCVLAGSVSGDAACTDNGNVCQYRDDSYCDGLFEKNLCDGPTERQCCVLRQSTGSCSESAAACRVLALHNDGSTCITLPSSHPSGESDDAYPILNIQDACNGKESKRSSCGECGLWSAPGGSVCIDGLVLTYIEEIAQLYPVTINSIAGACHGCQTRHYQGLAVDVDDVGPVASYVSKCNELGGVGIDEGTHVHCQFG